ncbi:glycosyl hydrolase family 28 protein [Paenibacillus nasutitermitis]|uniref:Glycosyl hydrolases family 28 n=1 Tax=Paenibacillus nasutitermitis TaxID=1652958 RepID=A0A916YJ37_9BACL|nr:glycosyl hydrolase family 28 protein [Paenibacillus nasutitermitis]GGD47362.1 hypothetical protein GCM10010911_01100 [Paenibacillus nasutitermitis]
MLLIPPFPQNEKRSNDYKVTLNGLPVEVYEARVSAVPFNTEWPGHQRALDQTEMASFLSFAADESVELIVEPVRPFEEMVVRPLSRDIHPVINGTKIAFNIDKTGQYTLELDGFHYALHIFVNPPANEEPIIQDGGTLYFGPGSHYPGIIEMQDNQTIYMDAGAVVHTSIYARGKKNIRITGYGILDNSTFQREDSRCLGCPTSLTFHNCRNIEISGIIIRDACSWAMTLFHCDNTFIDNIKMIGMWRYNSDGIDFVNSSNGIVQNSFLRNFDDAIVLKGLKEYDTRLVENILVQGCVVWCDWGRALEIGAETCADEYRNIVFRDCDIIHTIHIAMDIQNGDRANVTDILFENIRVEYSRHALPPIYQYTEDMTYPAELPPHIPVLFLAESYCGRWSNDNLLGSIRHIKLRDIHVYLEEGLPLPEISLSGASREHLTDDIEINGLYVNGVKIQSLKEANVNRNAFTSNVTLK